MKVAYGDARHGASAVSILAALLDVGLSADIVQQELDAIAPGARLVAAPVSVAGIRATSVCCDAPPSLAWPTWRELFAWLQGQALSERAASDIWHVLRCWREAEAHVQDVATDEAHVLAVAPGELLALLGAITGAHHLGAVRWETSPLPVGIAQTPAAAVVATLLTGQPVHGADAPQPLTPAAAALLTTLAAASGPLPAMTLHKVGYGVDQNAEASLFRLWFGESPGAGLECRTLLIVETNIDDMDPEFYDYVMSRLLTAGALDVALLPMQMKKNRPATLLRVLCAPDKLDSVRDIVLRETTTLGVRVHEVQRFALPRRSVSVQTPWGSVRVKVAGLTDGLSRPIPEYDDCRRLAEAHGVPLWQVYTTAQALAANAEHKDDRAG